MDLDDICEAEEQGWPYDKLVKFAKYCKDSKQEVFFGRVIKPDQILDLDRMIQDLQGENEYLNQILANYT